MNLFFGALHLTVVLKAALAIGGLMAVILLSMSVAVRAAKAGVRPYGSDFQ